MKLHKNIDSLKYAAHAFWFMSIFVVVVVGTVVCIGLDYLALQAMPLTALIATIPTSMALFGWVLRRLFPLEKGR